MWSLIWLSIFSIKKCYIRGEGVQKLLILALRNTWYSVLLRSKLWIYIRHPLKTWLKCCLGTTSCISGYDPISMVIGSFRHIITWVGAVSQSASSISVEFIPGVHAHYFQFRSLHCERVHLTSNNKIRLSWSNKKIQDQGSIYYPSPCNNERINSPLWGTRQLRELWFRIPSRRSWLLGITWFGICANCFIN